MLGTTSARSLVLATFLALAAAPSLGCGHHEGHARSPHADSITVVGRGEVSARPDLARVTLGVDTRAATVADANRQTNEKIAMVIAAVRGVGIAEADVRTSNYSVYFERTAPPEGYGGYGYPMPYVGPVGTLGTMAAPDMAATTPVPPPSAAPAPRAARPAKGPAAAGSAAAPAPSSAGSAPPAPSGSASSAGAPPPQGLYRVANTIEITIRDVNKVSTVLDAAVATGANEVQGVSFDIDAREPYDVKVREMAVADARKRALALATLHGKKLGRVLEVSEVASDGGRPMFSPMAAIRDASAGHAQIALGEITVQGQLQVVYAFEAADDD